MIASLLYHSWNTIIIDRLDVVFLMRETFSLLLEDYPIMKVSVSFSHGAINDEICLFIKSEKTVNSWAKAMVWGYTQNVLIINTLCQILYWYQTIIYSNNVLGILCWECNNRLVLFNFFFNKRPLSTKKFGKVIEILFRNFDGDGSIAGHSERRI